MNFNEGIRVGRKKMSQTSQAEENERKKKKKK